MKDIIKALQSQIRLNKEEITIVHNLEGECNLERLAAEHDGNIKYEYACVTDLRKIKGHIKILTRNQKTLKMLLANFNSKDCRVVAEVSML